MSLREKQLWGSLVAGLVVWGAYAIWAGRVLLDAGHPHPARDTGVAFLAALVVYVVVEAGLAGAVAWFQRRHRPAQDAALTQAGLIAGQVALMVLVAGVVVLLAGLMIVAVGAEHSQTDYSVGVTLSARFPLLLAHALLMVLLLSEGVRAVLTLLIVRRRRRR